MKTVQCPGTLAPTQAALARPWWAFQSRPGVLIQQLDGFTVAVQGPSPEERVDGPDVFLVHGMVDSSDTWDPLMSALSHCNVWRFDLPWSGRDGVAWPARHSALRWLQMALDLCPAKRGVFIGHSFGATMLLDWLSSDARAAAAVDGMMLLAPFYRGAQRTVDWSDIDDFARGVAQRLEDGLRIRMRAGAPSDAIVAAMAGKLCQRVMPDGLLELFRVFLRSRSWCLSQLRQPIAVVVGQHEGQVAGNSADDLATDLPNAVLTRLAGCGHYSMHEQAPQVRKLVSDFLTDIYASSKRQPRQGAGRMQAGAVPAAQFCEQS